MQPLFDSLSFQTWATDGEQDISTEPGGLALNIKMYLHSNLSPCEVCAHHNALLGMNFPFYTFCFMDLLHFPLSR